MLKNLLGVLEAAVVFGGLAGLVTGMYLAIRNGTK